MDALNEYNLNQFEKKNLSTICVLRSNTSANKRKLKSKMQRAHAHCHTDEMRHIGCDFSVCMECECNADYTKKQKKCNCHRLALVYHLLDGISCAFTIIKSIKLTRNEKMNRLNEICMNLPLLNGDADAMHIFVMFMMKGRHANMLSFYNKEEMERCKWR